MTKTKTTTTDNRGPLASIPPSRKNLTSSLSSSLLLTETHAPKDASTCCAPLKKMDALRSWLDGALSGRGAKALVLTGPPGCGKASAVRCVAAERGMELMEWEAPTPTLWREHAHVRDAFGGDGLEYASKVDHFVDYVDRATKYAPLAFLRRSVGSSSKPMKSKDGVGDRRVVLLIRDVPNSDESGRARILEAMRTLARACRQPCAVILTEQEDASAVSGALERGRGELSTRELRGAMEQSGATTLNFNAVTTAAMTKALQRVCEVERFELNKAQIDAIVMSSHGDVRSALSALEFWCCGSTRSAPSAPSSKPVVSKRKRGEPKEAPSQEAMAKAHMSSRDQSLGLFHALGKFLYNKRQKPEAPPPKGFENMQTRAPMQYDPEDVLSRAGIGSESVVAFLFENFPDFVDSRSVEWASAGIRYLSEASILARGAPSGVSRLRREDLGDKDEVGVDPNVLGEYCAGSVATRGVLFSGKRSSAGFIPMRGPQASKMERAANDNAEELRAVVGAAHAGDFFIGSNARAAAVETLPALRLIAAAGPEGAARVPFLTAKWHRPGEDASDYERRMAEVPPNVSAPRPAQLAAGVAPTIDRGTIGVYAAPLTLDDIDDAEDEIESDFTDDE
jgi:cell cycle checkpoint protein